MAGDEGVVGVVVEGGAAEPGVPAEMGADGSCAVELDLGHVLGLEHELHVEIELRAQEPPGQLRGSRAAGPGD